MNIQDALERYASIPELSSFKNPLFVGPHPDDIEFGCGALISKMKEMGATIHFIIVTDGSAGTIDPLTPPEKLKEIRYEESRKAANYLGVSTLDFINFDDGGLYEVEDVTREVSKYILKYLPDIIFTVDPNLRTECHLDHLRVGEGVRRSTQVVGYPEILKRHGVDISESTQYPRNIYLAYYFSDEPNTYTEISPKNLNDKITALMCHKSQMQGENALLLEYFKYKAMIDGKMANMELAESFMVIPPMLQHVFSQKLN